MKIETPQILWHNGSQNDNGKNAPLYSLSLLGGGAGGVGAGKGKRRCRVLATAGNTPEINLWKVWLPADGDDDVDDCDEANRGKGGSPTNNIGHRRILQTVQRSRVEHHLALTRHERSVNALSFSPDGRHLATAGDGGSIVVYSLPPSSHRSALDEAAEVWSSVTKENDLIVKIVGSPCEDVMDLDWSPDSRRIVVGSLDHTVLVLEDQSKPPPEVPSAMTGGDERPASSTAAATAAVVENANWKIVHRNCRDHTHYVQGVSYDPLGVYVCSMGSDRTVRVYRRKDPGAKGGKKGGSKAAGGSALATADANAGEGQTRRDEEAKERERKEEQVQRSLTAGKFELGKSHKVLKFYEDETPPTLPVAAAGTTAKDKEDRNDAPAPPAEKRKRHHLFADESTVESFFRRLSWTSDGAFLVTPAALWHPPSSSDEAAAVARREENKENSPAEDNAPVARPPTAESLPNAGGGGSGANAATPSFATYLFARHRFDRPYKVLSGLEKPSVVVRPNPVLFKLPPSSQPNDVAAPKGVSQRASTTAAGGAPPLPYRSVFAVLTTDTVVVYDTHHSRPLSIARGLHYAGLTDCVWSSDGRNLLVCSTDGYVSIVSFEEGELGEVYVPPSASGGALELSGKGAASAHDARTLIPPCPPGQSAVIEGRPAKKAKTSEGDNKDDGEAGAAAVPSSSSPTTPPPPSRKAGKKRIAPTLISAVGPMATATGPSAMVVAPSPASTEGEAAATAEGSDDDGRVGGTKRSAEGDSPGEPESVAAATATAGGSSGSEEQVVVGAVTKLSLEGKQQQPQPLPVKKKKRIQPTLVSAVQ